MMCLYYGAAILTGWPRGPHEGQFGAKVGLGRARVAVVQYAGLRDGEEPNFADMRTLKESSRSRIATLRRGLCSNFVVLDKIFPQTHVRIF